MMMSACGRLHGEPVPLRANGDVRSVHLANQQEPFGVDAHRFRHGRPLPLVVTQSEVAGW